MKRFYTTVAIENNDNDTYSISLDGKQIKTPLKKNLETQHQSIAKLIQGEWERQNEKVEPDSMPIMQILSTRIDKVDPERGKIVNQIMGYCDTDLLCYPAIEPEALATKQRALWQPYIDYINDKFDVTFQITTNIRALTQDDDIHDKIFAYLNDQDNDHLTLIRLVTELTGSLILAIAFVEKHISATEVFEAYQFEELYRIDLYEGIDPDTEKRHKSIKEDLSHYEHYRDTISS